MSASESERLISDPLGHATFRLVALRAALPLALTEWMFKRNLNSLRTSLDSRARHPCPTVLG